MTNQKLFIVFFLLIMLVIFVVYPLSKEKIVPSSTAIPQTAYNPTPCAGEEIDTIAKALTNPTHVCGLNITNDADLSRFASVSNKFINIKQLSIAAIEGTKMPPEIGKLTTLQVLAFNDIADQETIPSQIGNLTNLTLLRIASSDFERLPPEIGNLTNLRELILKRNEEMTTLPVSVAKLSHLQIISLQSNPQLKIPDSLVAHQTLTSVTIADQKITKLPYQIYTLPHLTALNYPYNAISTVSADLGRLTTLQEINFDLNRLSSFPSIGSLVNLEELILSNNQLSTLPAGIENLSKLQQLDVSGNKIDDSTMDSLQYLTELISLDLGDNKLTKLPPGIEKLKKLQYLRLEGNAIDPHAADSLKRALPHATIVL